MKPSINVHPEGPGIRAEANFSSPGQISFRDKGDMTYDSINIFGGDPDDARVAASGYNGELTGAMRRYVADYDDMVSNLEGENPLVDPGCIDCTVGTVPNKHNTGRCFYHLAKKLIGDL